MRIEGVARAVDQACILDRRRKILRRGRAATMTGKYGEQTEPRLDRVQSLVRAFSILDALAKRGNLTLGDVSRTVALPRSTAHRLLTTMESLHYVLFDRDTNQWSIGPQAFAVGAAFAGGRCDRRAAPATLHRLADAPRQSINLVEQGARDYLLRRTARG
jgi:IclR family acetate operon transcriptional repressor